MKFIEKKPIFASVLYWMIVASLALALVIWSKFMSPFHFGKVILFRWLVEAMIIIWVITLIKYPRYRPFWGDAHSWIWTPLMKLVVLFTGIMVISTIVSVDIVRSWWGTLERMGGLFTFLHYIAWLLIATTIIRTKREWLILLKISVVLGVISALYGFAQDLEIWRSFIQGEELTNPVGTIGNPALFSGFLIVNLFFALYFFAQKSIKIGWRIWYGAAIATMSAGIFMAAVRGSVAGTAVGLVLFALLLPRRSGFEKKVRRIAVGVVIATALTGILIIAIPGNPVAELLFPQDLRSFGISSRTVQTRLWAWGASWEAFQDRPILGWGQDNYAFGFNAHFNPLHYTGLGSETWFDRAHNIFLDVLIGQGIIGFAAFLGILFYLLYKLWRVRARDPVLSAALIGGIVAYFVHDSWILDTFVNYLLFFLIIGFVDWLEQERRDPKTAGHMIVPVAKRHARLSAGSLSLMQGGAIITIAVTIISLGWWSGARAIHVNWNTTRAMIAGTRDLDEALRRWEKALEGPYAGKPESVFQLGLFAIRLEENDRLPIGRLDSSDVRGGMPVPRNRRFETLKYAASEMETFLNEHPYEAQLHIILGRAQNMIGQQYDREYAVKAQKTMERAVELSPTRPRFYYELGQSLNTQNRVPEALIQYERALSINKNVGVSWWYVGLMKSQLGRHLEGLEDIERAIELRYSPLRSVFNTQQLAGIYLALNSNQDLVDLYESAIKVHPQESSLYGSLAEAYRRLGRYQEAAQAAENARQLNPSLSDTVEQFLGEIASESSTIASESGE